MKRIISLLLITCLIITSFIVPIHAAEVITVKVDDRILTFDVPPQTINGRTMVPMRAIFENLGAMVEYTPANQAGDDKPFIYAYKEGALTDIGMFINVPELYKRDLTTGSISEIITLDAAPTVIDGRTLVPVRAIAKAFDCNVTWDNATKTVSIVTDPNAITAVNTIESFTLNETEIDMVTSEFFLLEPVIKPTELADSTDITWSSTNEDVVGVFKTGNQAMILAGKPGKAVIVAKAANGMNAYCNVEVTRQ